MKNGIIESYEDLENIREIEHLKQENRQLKKLLKDCITPLKVYNEMFGYKEELLTKIDEVLK